MNIKILNEHGLSDNDPLSHAFAYKGKGAPKKTEAELEAEKAQQEELNKLKAQEESRTAAMSRSRRGRASLLSGSETGANSEDLSNTLG